VGNVGGGVGLDRHAVMATALMLCMMRGTVGHARRSARTEAFAILACAAMLRAHIYTS
jgi:hypothetical protein